MKKKEEGMGWDGMGRSFIYLAGALGGRGFIFQVLGICAFSENVSETFAVFR